MTPKEFLYKISRSSFKYLSNKKKLEVIEQFKKEICIDIASKAWLQALKKANDPISEKGFKIWYEEYMKNK